MGDGEAALPSSPAPTRSSRATRGPRPAWPRRMVLLERATRRSAPVRRGRGARARRGRDRRRPRPRPRHARRSAAGAARLCAGAAPRRRSRGAAADGAVAGDQRPARGGAADDRGAACAAHDRAAWRTQAFVLALTGDTVGAARPRARDAARRARTMAPFFARLPRSAPRKRRWRSISAPSRATAARALMRAVDTSADPGAIALAAGTRPAPSRRGSGPAPAEPVSAPPRAPRPIRRATGSHSLIPRRPARRDRAGRSTRPVPPSPEPEPERPRAAALALRSGARSERSRPRPPRPRPPPPKPPPPRPHPPDAPIGAGFTLLPQGEQPVVPPAGAGRSRSPRRPSGSRRSRAPSSPRAAGRRGAFGPCRAARPCAAETAPPQRPRPAPAGPSEPPLGADRHRRRARGACRANSPGCARAPEALGGRSAYSAPFGRSSNRLLVGPFDTGARRRRSSSPSSAEPTSRHLPGQARRARK